MTKEKLRPSPQRDDSEKHESTTKTQMHWQHRNKKGDQKALNLSIGRSILSQTKHPEQTKKLRNPKSGHRFVHFLSNQTTTNAFQKRIANIAKKRASDGKLTKVNIKHSLAGKKSVRNKSKADDKED